MTMSLTVTCASFTALLLFLIRKWCLRHTLPLPPGPKGFPVIGTPSELPSEYAWLHVAKHKDIYGPISAVNVFGQTFVLLNDLETARDLLEKRSSIHSGRPFLVFSHMCGCGNFITLTDTGPTHKAFRKCVQQFFGSTSSILRLTPIVEAETRHFLARILSSPKELQPSVKAFAAAVILNVTYGYHMETEHQDPLVEEVEEMVEIFGLSLQAAAWLVDALPALRHLPSWMPGQGFKKTAKAWKQQVMQSAERPYIFVKQQMAAGTARPSYVSALLEQTLGGPDQYQDYIYKWSAATMYGAGSDTTSSLVYSFFLALVLYPEMQKKAQEEIDRVIGPHRLPTLSDRHHLPYVEAVFKEAFRWHTNIPLGVPHVTKEDDVYQGYIIPKGSILLPNSWLFSHDPSTYHDPFTFKPERFLPVDGFKPELDPSTSAFGFGHRSCLGKKLAESSVFHVVAMTLATLHVGKAHDAHGNEITPVYEVTNGVFSHPKPFECSITARSMEARELILTAHKGDDVAHNDAAAIQAIVLDLKNEGSLMESVA